MQERLDKILVSQGMASRRDVQHWIRCGQVTVDGETVCDPSQKLDAEAQRIEVKGMTVVYRRHLYLMLNKPPGLLCVSRDPRVPTVMELVPAQLRRKGLFPAGRLDKDTVGLVLLTDDGDFAHRMLSPRKEIEKCYQARIDAPVTQEHIRIFAQGTSLEDGTLCLPAKLRVLDQADQPLVEVRICEGRYHQIKRMFASVGRKVLWLKRISIGGLGLDSTLKEGKCRELTETEKAAVFSGCL